MKKCPDKKQLYRFDDPELSNEQRKACEEHLGQCSACRQELEEIKKLESSLRSQTLAAFAPEVIKNGAMRRIRLESNPGQSSQPRRKSYWFWILAPGMALIFLAALFNAQPVKTGRAAMVSCHASSDNSLVNDKIIEFGRQIEMQHLPMHLKGNFVFTMAATQTSSFEHSGESQLVCAEFDKLEFNDASATFTLVSGNPVSVKINGELREIDVGPLLINISKLPAPKTEVVSDGNKKSVASSASETVGAATETSQNPNQSLKATESLPIQPQQPTKPVAPSEASDTFVPIASESQDHRIDETVNPFLDKPLELKGN